MKACTCKGDKVDPKCPACNKKIDYLKDFHRLNPEAKPSKKTAGLFNGPAQGFFGGMSSATKARLLSAAKGALPAAAVGIPAAMIAGATADKGEGTGDALRAGLLAGGTAAAANFGHNMMMSGKTPWAKSYRQGIGTDIRNLANRGRAAMGIPKVASVDQFKLALEPYDNYGQYGHEQQDNGPGLGTMLAMGGIGALGARALHGGLMASRGQFARGYQANLGNAIRAATNRARTGMGMKTVPLPPHGIVGKVQDIAHNVSQAVEPALATGAKVVAGAKTLQGVHDNLMGANHPLGNAYSKVVGTPVQQAIGTAKSRLKQWAAKPSAATSSKPVAKPAAKVEAAPKSEPKAEAPKAKPATEDTKVGPGVTKRSPAKKEASLNDLLISVR